MADTGIDNALQSHLAGFFSAEGSLNELEALRDAFTRFMLQYKFAIEEVLTKVNILRDEFTHLHNENPIEHVTSRLKSPSSVLDKVERKACPANFDAIRNTILDIAGVRIVCSFVPDIYRVLDALTKQDDLTVIQVKDYIASPKPNGYRSLHLIVSVPVFLSSGTVPVTVEIQIRTIAMDFWASLEHKIYYKYDRQVPEEILAGLAQSAQVAHELDTKMTSLRDQVRRIDSSQENKQQDEDSRFVEPRPAVIAADEGVVPALDLIQRLANLRRSEA